MIWLFAIVCVLCYCFVGNEAVVLLGVSKDSLWQCFTYEFVHASWWHLGVNMLSLVVMIRPIGRLWERRYASSQVWPLHSTNRLLLAAYVGAVLAGAMCATDVPTVGCSGMVFFLLGVLIVLNPTKKQLKAYLWVAVAVLLQIYFGKSNTALHLVAFAEGATFTIIREFMQHYQSGNLSIYQYNDIPIIQINDDR